MRVVVAYGGGDEGLSWGSSRKRGGCRGVAAAVEARGGGDRVDQMMVNTFGLSRNTRRKSFPAAAAMAGIRPVVAAGKIGREEES
ncbi:hypothetical protein Tco_0399030, partial [Tanacetum coccineum]